MSYDRFADYRNLFGALQTFKRNMVETNNKASSKHASKQLGKLDL